MVKCILYLKLHIHKHTKMFCHRISSSFMLNRNTVVKKHNYDNIFRWRYLTSRSCE